VVKRRRGDAAPTSKEAPEDVELRTAGEDMTGRGAGREAVGDEVVGLSNDLNQRDRGRLHGHSDPK
jgi:hypothetical protein